MIDDDDDNDDDDDDDIDDEDDEYSSNEMLLEEEDNEDEEDEDEDESSDGAFVDMQAIRANRDGSQSINKINISQQNDDESGARKPIRRIRLD